MGTFLHVLSEQYRTEHFFGAERSVLTEHLDPMFPRTLAICSVKTIPGNYFIKSFLPFQKLTPSQCT